MVRGYILALLLLLMVPLSACSSMAGPGPVPQEGQWVMVDLETDIKPRTLAAGGGRWVLGGENGKFLYSSRGHDWFKSSLEEWPLIEHVVSDRFDFWAFTDSSEVYRSKDDGETWVLEANHVMARFSSLVYRQGRFVGLSGKAVGLSTDTKERWRWFNPPFVADSDEVVATPEGFGIVSPSASTIHYSSDGMKWDEHKVSLPDGLLPASLVGGKIGGSNLYFLTTTNDGRPGPVFSSPDGLTWSTQPVADDFAVTRVFYAEDLFIAVSSVQTDRVYASWDGQQWHRQDLPEPVEIMAVAANLGKVAALGKTGRLLIYEASAQ